MQGWVIGIHDGHNASAAVVRNGEILSAVQEERMTRVKNQGGVPAMALKEALSLANASLSATEELALNGKYMTFDHWDRESLSDWYEQSGNLLEQLKQPLKGTAIDGLYQKGKEEKRRSYWRSLGFEEEKIHSVDHHMAHAAAAYYGSGWEGEVLVLTCDGGGDRLSATVNIGRDGDLERLASIPENESIGHLYSIVTFLMGMVPLEHEYKIMGLAPYSTDSGRIAAQAKQFEDLFEFAPSNPLVWRRRKGVPPMFSAAGMVRRLLHRSRFDVVAAGLQLFIERMLLTWVTNCVRETGIRRVACAGGTFMNVKANKEILSSPEVEELFVFPSCGDETNSIGAAYFAYAQRCKQTHRPVDIPALGPIYWGRNFTNDDIENSLQAYRGSSRFKATFEKDIERKIAEHLASGKIVARAKGRMEFGARSLGNRSILARADNLTNIRIINDMIKNRDFWMPFAPSVLAERSHDYYENPKGISAPYMILAFDSVAESRGRFLAAQHPYDFTVRPHEVTPESNFDYYRVLKEFEEISGDGIVLNTSFNLHGYPIVYRPEEALSVLDQSGLEFLALGDFWVSKS